MKSTLREKITEYLYEEYDDVMSPSGILRYKKSVDAILKEVEKALPKERKLSGFYITDQWREGYNAYRDEVVKLLKEGI